MNRSIRYSKISSLNQLRNERARLKSDITNKELLLNLQCKDFTEYFSVANMISLFLSRINSLTPFWTWAQSAYNFIRSLLKEEETMDTTDTIKPATPLVKKATVTKRKSRNPATRLKKQQSETE